MFEIKTKQNKMNKQKCQKPTEREKIFVNKETHKGLISKMHKHLRQLFIRKTNSTIKK